MFSGDYKFENAYKHFVDSKDVLEFLCIKFMFGGPPRQRKSTTRRRVTKEIIDLKSAEEMDQIHGSTGTVEHCSNMLVKSTSDLEKRANWTIVQNLTDEACILFHRLKDSMEEKSEPQGVALVGGDRDKTVTVASGEASNTKQPLPSKTRAQSGLLQKDCRENEALFDQN